MKMNNLNTTTTPSQSYLEHAFEIGNGEFTDLVCEECAVKWAEQNELEWRGGQAYNSHTIERENSDAYASDVSTYADGESDYPPSCCGVYLHGRLTTDGVEYLKQEFPKWVQELYGV
jgi:hypothetical protein